jgi:Glycosyl hydrolases family 16
MIQDTECTRALRHAGHAGCTRRAGESIADEAHIYSVLWTPTAMQFFIDG